MQFDHSICSHCVHWDVLLFSAKQCLHLFILRSVVARRNNKHFIFAQHRKSRNNNPASWVLFCTKIDSDENRYVDRKLEGIEVRTIDDWILKSRQMSEDQTNDENSECNYFFRVRGALGWTGAFATVQRLISVQMSTLVAFACKCKHGLQAPDTHWLLPIRSSFPTCLPLTPENEQQQNNTQIPPMISE